DGRIERGAQPAGHLGERRCEYAGAISVGNGGGGVRREPCSCGSGVRRDSFAAMGRFHKAIANRVAATSVANPGAPRWEHVGATFVLNLVWARFVARRP